MCYDISDGRHGDNDCAVGVTGISSSTYSPTVGSPFTVSCTSTQPNVNSVSAYIGSSLCSYSSWSGNTAAFSCTCSSAGSQTIKCAVDTSKSYKSGIDQTASVTCVNQPPTCSSYTSSSSCNADTNCEWCPECVGTKYTGAASRCVNAGPCPCC